jgi:nucleoside-diphosphate-sugar epimerase
MRVLLTGGNGFIGSHILDDLRAENHEVRLLLRETSNTRFIEGHLPEVEVHYGSLLDADSLMEATAGTQCIIHCAGKTKALDPEDYYRVNRDGTAKMVEAANRHEPTVQQFIHISSRAVNGPGTAENPAREEDEPAPLSDYGRSKMEAEREVTDECEVPWTVLRPSGVYGPRDTDFLGAFRAASWHILPLFDGGTQSLNLAYGPDVAAAAMQCLGEKKAHRRIYNVASPHICTTRDFLQRIAEVMGAWTLEVRMPSAALYPICLLHEWASHVTGRACILNRQKYKELRAPGWACSVKRMREELGFVCPTPLEQGIRATLQWYRQEGWLS